MIRVEWAIVALIELDKVLMRASSPQGAETMKRAIARAVKTIALFPHGGRFIRCRNWYEAVVTGRVPLLHLYRVVEHSEGTRARIIGVFNTRRDPRRKPRRRR